MRTLIILSLLSLTLFGCNGTTVKTCDQGASVLIGPCTEIVNEDGTTMPSGVEGSYGWVDALAGFRAVAAMQDGYGVRVLSIRKIDDTTISMALVEGRDAPANPTTQPVTNSSAGAYLCEVVLKLSNNAATIGANPTYEWISGCDGETAKGGRTIDVKHLTLTQSRRMPHTFQLDVSVDVSDTSGTSHYPLTLYSVW